MKKSRREKRWTVSTKYKAVLKQMLQMRGKFIGEQGQGSWATLEQSFQADNGFSGQMEITDCIWMHRGKKVRKLEEEIRKLEWWVYRETDESGWVRQTDLFKCQLQMLFFYSPAFPLHLWSHWLTLVWVMLGSESLSPPDSCTHSLSCKEIQKAFRSQSSEWESNRKREGRKEGEKEGKERSHSPLDDKVELPCWVSRESCWWQEQGGEGAGGKNIM